MKDLDSGVHIFVGLFRCILFKFYRDIGKLQSSPIKDVF